MGDITLNKEERMEQFEVRLLNKMLFKLDGIEKQLNRIADALEEENNLSKEIIGSNKDINRLLEVVLLAMSRMANNNEVVKNE